MRQNRRGQAHFALVGAEEPCKCFQEGGLARSVRPENGHPAAPLDCEIDPPQRPPPAEPPRYAGGLQNNLRHLPGKLPEALEPRAALRSVVPGRDSAPGQAIVERGDGAEDLLALALEGESPPAPSPDPECKLTDVLQRNTEGSTTSLINQKLSIFL